MRRLGFTLLEVMVAVLILGIALTAIFASEVGAVKTALRSNQMTVASLLARCKMGEIEEQVMKEGLPAIDDSGNDGCCEDAEVEGFTCDWRIDRVVLPDDIGMEEEGAEGAEGAAGAEGAGAIPGLPAGVGEDSPIGVDEILAAGGGGTDDAMAEMALSIAFPILKPSIEEQVRRATVTVRWTEMNSGEHDMTVVQFLVAAPQTPAGEPATDGTTPPGTTPPPGGNR